MQIVDSFTVGAPVEQVWAFLFDLDRMSRCVPRVETIAQLDDRTYRGVIRVKVGAIAATFSGTATLTEVEPPQRMAATLQAEDKTVASLVLGAFASTLVPVDGGTEVRYQMDVSLRGRLAQFGTAVVQATTRRMTAEFTQKLRAGLEGGAQGGPA
jgi:hypothetical protein